MHEARAAAGSLIFFVIAPGIVAGLVPWLLTGWKALEQPTGGILLQGLGVALLLAGAFALVYAFVCFVREGRGTPAPIAPTERLVVGGLYRYVRNPMYVAVIAVIVGQALLLGQPVLVLYALAVGAAVVAFVYWYEEPTLSRQFGKQYDAYYRAVPGWWPRLRPWNPDVPDRQDGGPDVA